jgi:predicted transposase YdaD
MSIFEYDEEKEMELIRQAEFEKGEAYGKADIVLNMHKKNYSPKEISEIVDMSEEEVKAIIYSQEPALV